MQHTVDVWGKPQTVEVHQKTKAVWIAVGAYMGKRIEVKGRSASAAITQWQDAVRFKGNG